MAEVSVGGKLRSLQGWGKTYSSLLDLRDFLSFLDFLEEDRVRDLLLSESVHAFSGLEDERRRSCFLSSFLSLLLRAERERSVRSVRVRASLPLDSEGTTPCSTSSAALTSSSSPPASQL